MKKITKFIFIFVLAFLLVGCKKEKKEEESIYASELNAYMEEIIPSLMTKSFEIPLEFSYSDGNYAMLEWESLTPNAIGISKKGKISYLDSLFDTIAKAKCNIYINNALVQSVEYSINVKGEMTESEYIEKFKDLYLPDNVYKTIELPKIENQIFASRKIEGTVTYNSLNENVLGSNGKYKQVSKDDTNVTLNFTISINGFTVNGSKNILVLGKNDEVLVDNAALWLEDTWKNNKTIKADLDFPLTDDAGKVDMKWESNNKDIVDDSGKFVKYVVGEEVIFSVTISINDYYVVKELKMNTISKDEAIEYIMNRMHKDEYYQSYFYTYIVSGGHANEDFGMLNFYTLDLDESKLVKSEEDNNYIYGSNSYNKNTTESLFKLQMIPNTLTYKRPLVKKPSVEFITIHDTGDYKFNAQQWADEVTTSSREVSWHFTVDDTQIIQHVPLEEVAYHAGDGGRLFKLTDTGVKYTIKNPKIEVGDNGKLYINGIESNCFAPYDDSYNYYKDITPAGLYTEMGENGNYWINTYYYNSTYKKISNGGGNYNSIGIESCVHNGVKYSYVQKRFANLIAHLLNIYNLDTSRVLMHRNFSGKYCPQSMLRTTEKGQLSQFSVEYFYEMIEIEYFIIKYLPDLKVTYTSNNPSILTNDGEILSYVTEDTTVSYTVNASCDGINYSNTYTTLIHPKTA